MADVVWTVRSVLSWAREWLQKKGVEQPRLDAELLLARALACDRVRLYIDHDKPLKIDELAAFKALIQRRALREPVAYILGVKEFYGRPFAVDKRVFIPRPDTELVVQLALTALGEAADGARALDLCAGSGAIGVTLAAERPALQVDLVELSPGAAEVATANAARHAAGRATVHVGDLFAALPRPAQYQVLTANPPYIAESERATLAPEIAAHEPSLALFAADEGLAVIRRIVAEARRWISPGGMLAMELDPGQAARALALCAEAGLLAGRAEQGLAGDLRVVVAYAPPERVAERTEV